MAINAKFQADFSSFLTAVQAAETKLRTFEDGAAKAGSAVNKMANSLSGNTIIQQASIMAEAVERVGGVSKLTEKELAHVASTATEAANKLRAMGQDVPAGIQKIADAAKSIQPALSMADQAAGLLKSTFGQFTLAGLATNAISSLGSGLAEFANIGFNKLPAVQASFSKLTTSMKQDGAQMLSNMNSATKGLVSNYDLMLSANKAMLLGLPVTSESMGDLAKTATILGRAMGQDATKSLDDLITALGRSSPMILDNLGLTVKVGEANEAYAAKLGKSAEALSESEKKMAFYEAAMEAAKRKTAELGEQTRTLGEIVESAWTSVGNVVTGATAAVNVGVGAAMSSLQNFAQFAENVIKSGLGAAIMIQAALEEAKKASAAAAPKAGPLADVQAMIDFQRAAEKARVDGLVPLTAAQKEFVLATTAGHKSVKEIADVLKVSQAAVQGVVDAHNKATEATKKHTEALEAMFRQYSGAVAAQKMADLDVVFRRLEGDAKTTEVQLRAIVRDAADLARQGAVLTPGLFSMAMAFGELNPKVTDGIDGMGQLGQKFTIAVPPLNALARGLPAVTSGIDNLISHIPKMDLGFQFGAFTKKVKEGQDSLGELTVALRELSQSSSGTFSAMVSHIANMTAALQQAAKAKNIDGSDAKGGILGPMFDKDASAADKWGAAVTAGVTVVTGALHVLDVASQATSKSMGALNGALAGAAAGAAFGPWGAAIGAAGGALVGLIKGMTAGRRTVEAFAESFGGFNDLHKRLLDSLGGIGEEFWIKLTQQIGRSDQAGALRVIKEIQGMLANAPDALAAAAGYQTKAELQAVADKAKQVYEYMLASGKYTADAIADAFEKSKEAQVAALGGTSKAQQAELDAITAKYADSISKLESEYKSLSDSIGKEAEEEFMGIVETQERERLKQVTAEKAAQEAMRDAEIAAKKSTFDEMLDNGEKVNKELRLLFGKELEIPYRFVGQNTPSFTGGSATYSPPASMPPVGSGSSTVVQFVTPSMQVLAQGVLPELPAARRRLGVPS